MHRTSNLSLVYFLGALALADTTLAQQILTPAISFSVHDEPIDGLGDTFNATPFEGLIRTQSTRADRALQEFDVSSLAGQLVVSATLAGEVNVNNSFNNGVRTFDFGLYAGNGVADLGDYQAPTLLVGSGQYAPPITSSFTYNFDVTNAVRSLLAGGASHVGLRVEGTSNPNFPNILSDTQSRLVVTLGAGIGAPYCGPAVPNTSGASAILRATGSLSVAANDVTLQASGMPANVFGFFLNSPNQGFVQNPGGSPGNLCLANPIGRYVAPGQIKNSGANGAFGLVLDLDQTPSGNVFVMVAAGETWHFQAWFRDVGPQGQASANFTDGLTLQFL